MRIPALTSTRSSHPGRLRLLTGAAILAAALLVAFAPLPSLNNNRLPATRSFHIDASQFSYGPSEIRVDRGDIVTIELNSTDSVHGLYLDGYGISVQADPGQPASMTFIADRGGSFRFRCNVTCGALHPFMIGKLTVGRDGTLLRGFALGLVGALGIMWIMRQPHSRALPS